MSATATSIDALKSLHPSAVRDPDTIAGILSQLERERIPLRRGVNERIDPEIAYLERVEGRLLRFRTKDLRAQVRDRVLLNFRIGPQSYSMAVEVIDAGDSRIDCSVPSVIYRSERRDRQRIRSTSDEPTGELVLLASQDRTLGYGRVKDFSPEGLGVEVPSEIRLDRADRLVVHFLDGERKGLSTAVEMRHERHADPAGWKRIGLSRLRRDTDLVSVERSDRLGPTQWSALQTSWSVMSSALRFAGSRTLPRLLRSSSQDVQVRVVDYENPKGERIRAIVDSWGDTRGAPAIVIPPAWGRTKETLLPLAATIVSSFRAARRPVTVIRFDGIRRRGESFNEPSCRSVGSEYHRFTFSQAVDDVLSTVEFLHAEPAFRPQAIVLVTFSAASIDGRRAAAVAADRGLSGWISVVGSADLQSMMRIVSGGVDFVGGVERGIRFGRNMILGVEVDIDLAGRDALDSKLAFLEDACRDFEAIQIPVTWFHGRYDAWMELERVRIALSSGNRTRRRLVEIPTGHQLRSSKEALAVFQLIACEAGRMVRGAPIKARTPNLHSLERRRTAERTRLPRKMAVDKRAFWKAYLLGRDGVLGIELMTGTSAFREFMEEQIKLLRLSGGECILDLGAGTGSFPLQLAEAQRELMLRVVGLDFVRESLRRAGARLHGVGSSRVRTNFAVCELDVGNRIAVPLRDESVDAAMASLLLGYLDSPLDFFKEVARVLKPGGRLVASGLRKDADVSRIFRSGVSELASNTARPRFDPSEISDLAEVSRDFLSDAVRLFDLEEEGVFEFREPQDIASMLEAAGFEQVHVRASFGDPPQAMVICARRRHG